MYKILAKTEQKEPKQTDSEYAHFGTLFEAIAYYRIANGEHILYNEIAEGSERRWLHDSGKGRGN